MRRDTESNTFFSNMLLGPQFLSEELRDRLRTDIDLASITRTSSLRHGISILELQLRATPS
jgi:hypothetical protein